jgi:hypothetical protein
VPEEPYPFSFPCGLCATNDKGCRQGCQPPIKFRKIEGACNYWARPGTAGNLYLVSWSSFTWEEPFSKFFFWSVPAGTGGARSPGEKLSFSKKLTRLKKHVII